MARAAPDAEAELARRRAAAGPFVLPPLERFTAVVERPLFSPTRRMPAPPPASVARRAGTDAGGAEWRQGPAEPELRFFGTVRAGWRGRGAGDLSRPRPRWRGCGPAIAVGEWQVIAVERNRLVLGLGEERRSFEIFGAGMRGAAAGRAVAGAPPRCRMASRTAEPYADEAQPELE